jgi:uncharacterized protein (TIGR02599 family)
MKTLQQTRTNSGFTLAEVLVSSVLIVMVMGFLFVTVDQTRRTINSTTAKVGQFQAARLAFDALTRNMSQATLNTYWDLDRDANTQNPIRYRRQSDLHFIIDRTTAFGLPGTSSSKHPLDCVFFQAPLGFTAEENTNANKPGVTDRKYRALSNALSVVGYFVEWNEDLTLPEFIKNDPKLAQKRYRYRLMEVLQPAETNMVYNNSNYTSNMGGTPALTVSPGSPYNDPRDWVRVALGVKDLPTNFPIQTQGKQNSARVLAENVVALIIIPKVGEKDRTPGKPDSIDDLLGVANKLTMYDSRPKEAYDVQARNTATGAGLYADLNTKLSPQQLKQLHQLPPILQVTMVAIDEDAGARLQDNSINPPDWTSGLFNSYSTLSKFQEELGDPNKLDPKSLIYRISNPERKLPTPQIKNYRVFTTDVVVRGSKWTKFN